jgi:hypothetical protein
VLLFSESTSDSPKPVYQDYFIAAVPRAALISDTFEELCRTISSGKMRLKDLRLVVTTNEDVGSTIVPNITKNIIQSLLDTMTPNYYSAQVINVDISLFVRPQCRNRLSFFMKRPDWEYIAECGKPVHILHVHDSIDRKGIED